MGATCINANIPVWRLETFKGIFSHFQPQDLWICEHLSFCLVSLPFQQALPGGLPCSEEYGHYNLHSSWTVRSLTLRLEDYTQGSCRWNAYSFSVREISGFYCIHILLPVIPIFYQLVVLNPSPEMRLYALFLLLFIYAFNKCSQSAFTCQVLCLVLHILRWVSLMELRGGVVGKRSSKPYMMHNPRYWIKILKERNTISGELITTEPDCAGLCDVKLLEKSKALRYSVAGWTARQNFSSKPCLKALVLSQCGALSKQNS